MTSIRRAGALLVVALCAAIPASAEETVTARVHVAPLLVELEITRPTVVEGRETTAVVRVSNETARRLQHVSVSLLADPDHVHLVPSEPQLLGSIGPGRASRLEWILCAELLDREPEHFLLVAQAEVTDHGRAWQVESPARLLTVEPAKRARSCTD